MVPAGEITAQTVDGLAEHLEQDDVIIDGGNSYYRDDIARADAVSGRGITTWTSAQAVACGGWSVATAS